MCSPAARGQFTGRSDSDMPIAWGMKTDFDRTRERSHVHMRPWGCVVSVTAAHKILITVAVLFFFGYAFWELRQYTRLGEMGALLRAVAALLGAVGFAVYLRAFVRSLR